MKIILSERIKEDSLFFIKIILIVCAGVFISILLGQIIWYLDTGSFPIYENIRTTTFLSISGFCATIVLFAIYQYIISPIILYIKTNITFSKDDGSFMVTEKGSLDISKKEIFITKRELNEHLLRYGVDSIYTKVCDLNLKECSDAELLKEYLFFTRSYYKCVTNERLLNILNSELISRNIKILLLNGKGYHSFDIKLSKQNIEKYAIENNIDFELALECFIIDVILDTEESNFSTLVKIAKENQLDNSKPSPFSILSADERKLYDRFKETNLID